jgi:malate dehydrogenase
VCSTNAGIIANIAAAVGEAAPDAILLVISNPVNSTVPICAEVLKRKGVYNKNKLFGVTTLDIVRANTFVAEHQGWDVLATHVPVVCGHSGVTIVPLLSQVPNAKFTEADRDAITQRIQTAGDLVVKLKAGGGSATLSMAFAGAQFTDSILRALHGEKGVIECTFVESDVQPGLAYFSSPVELGVNGIEKIHGLGTLDSYEQQKITNALPELKASINKGVQFVKTMSKL